MTASDKTVYVVDDDAGVRDSLTLLLELRGFQVRAFASAAAFLRDYANDPGCLLLDIRMPDMDGLALQRLLTERGDSLPIIIITAHGDVAAARTALKAGAVDFLEKPINDELLLTTVRDALRHDAEARSEQSRRLEIRQRLDRLTQREREVMDLTVRGLHNREIAQQLGISARTVEVYKARLMEKLQLHRTADLMRLAMSLGPDDHT